MYLTFSFTSPCVISLNPYDNSHNGSDKMIIPIFQMGTPRLVCECTAQEAEPGIKLKDNA